METQKESARRMIDNAIMLHLKSRNGADPGSALQNSHRRPLVGEMVGSGEIATGDADLSPMKH